jgi:hypothetical protein
MQRNARPIQHGAPVRLFDVGQTVRLKGGLGTGPKTGDIYRVTATLPPRGASPQYRIRSEGEPYDRVVTEDSLERVVLSASDNGTALIERTFGHGQGAETLEPRNQEAEAGKSPGQA